LKTVERNAHDEAYKQFRIIKPSSTNKCCNILLGVMVYCTYLMNIVSRISYTDNPLCSILLISRGEIKKNILTMINTDRQPMVK
jgi:hypothetical protein